MHLLYHVMSSPNPLGLLFLAASEKGLRYVEFMDRRSLKRTIAAHESSESGATWEPSLFELRPLADQLEELLTGARKTIDWPLDLSGDAVSRSVYRALAQIPYGEAVSVAELARAAGEPRNVRAVAQAVLTNPLAIVVPCHRVLGADGMLSNYVGGLPRKKFLLMVEQRFRDVGGLDENRVIGELYRRVTTQDESVRHKQKPMARKRAPALAAAPASKPAGSKAVAFKGAKPKPAVKAAKPPVTKAVMKTAAAAKPALKAATRTAKPAVKRAGKPAGAKSGTGLSAKAAPSARTSSTAKLNGAARAGVAAKAVRKRSR